MTSSKENTSRKMISCTVSAHTHTHKQNQSKILGAKTNKYITKENYKELKS